MEAEVEPRSSRFDEEGGGIAGARRGLFDQGLARIPFEGYGGISLPFGVYSLAMELVGSADAPTAMSVGVHNMVAEGVFRFGTAAQKESVLSDLITGRKLGAFSLTEPTSGSDARSMSTIATKEGSGYVINGSKMFITNAGEADVYMVFAKTEKGHSVFLVDRSTPGLAAGEDIPKLGMRGSRTSEIRFDDCRVPSESLLGEDGKGFEYAKSMLNGSRIIMGSICVGIALTAYRKALDYGRQRVLFGERLADMQMTREKIANMRTEITSGRLLCLYASRLKELGLDHASEAAQAKVLSTEMAARGLRPGDTGLRRLRLHQRRHPPSLEGREAPCHRRGSLGGAQDADSLKGGLRFAVNIVVCVKHAVDESELRADPSGRPQLQGAQSKMSAFDRNAVEEAVRIKEKRSGTVTVISLGSGDWKKSLKEALAMGADKAVAVSSNQTLDALSTSYYLSRAVTRVGPADLVFFSEGASDTYEGLVGPMTAEWLGLPFLGYARKLDVGDGTVRCDLALEEQEEVAEAALPAVVSVVSEINEPRYPTLLQIMQASKKPMEEVALDSLKDERVPPVRVTVTEVQVQALSRKKVVFEGSPEESSKKLVDALRRDGVL